MQEELVGEDMEEEDDDDDSFSAPMIDASYLRTDSHLNGNNGNHNGLGLSVNSRLS